MTVVPSESVSGRLRGALASGRFVVTAEVGPPSGADPAVILRKAELVGDWVDAVNVTDNQGAHVRMSSFAGSLLAQQAGVEPVMQLTCRDRNRLALQSDLLSAGAVGIPNVLLLTGDHPSCGDHPEAMPVFDLDGIQLTWTARTLRDEGMLASGQRLSARPEWFIGTVENPFAPPTEFRARRLAKKVAAGAEFAQTQYVFDLAAFERWIAESRALGITDRCAIIAGVGPIRSLRVLEFLRNGVPGIHVPDSVERRLRGVPADRVADEGMQTCVETIQQLGEIPGVAGVHVMAFGFERGVPELLQRAGVGPGGPVRRRPLCIPPHRLPTQPAVRRMFMLLDRRPHIQLRDTKPIDMPTSVAPAIEVLSDDGADLARVRVVCDWVQYRQNFRDVVDVRPIHTSAESGDRRDLVPVDGASDLEVAIDVRRSAEVALKEVTRTRLQDADSGRVFLEEWAPGSDSCIWEFNALYWSAVQLWEKATGRGYEEALPGGHSGARNREAARELIHELFAVWDPLATAGTLPEQLYVVELGVGNGGQAQAFLDEFRELDRTHGRGYYRRLQYLLCDSSQHILGRARQTTGDHAEHVSVCVLDATRPCRSLGFLRHQVFLVSISNVYDNLPTDEVAQISGQTYQVQTRAFLPATEAAELSASVGASVEELPGLVHKLLRLGPSLLAEAAPAHFADAEAAVHFWQRSWSLLRLAERYVPLAGLDLYELAPSVSGEALRPLLESRVDIRMHVNNGALASFVDSLMLLHPVGRLVCHDLFVTDTQGYCTHFRGPDKYDGSVVNWVNGALLTHVGNCQGFDVHYTPFPYHNSGNIVTMTAQMRD